MNDKDPTWFYPRYFSPWRCDVRNGEVHFVIYFESPHGRLENSDVYTIDSTRESVFCMLISTHFHYFPMSGIWAKKGFQYYSNLVQRYRGLSIQRTKAPNIRCDIVTGDSPSKSKKGIEKTQEIQVVFHSSSLDG